MVTPRIGRTTPSPQLSFKTLSRVFVTLVALVLALQTYLLTSNKLSLTSSSSNINKQSSDAPSLDPHSIGQILPDGTVTFTPEEFQLGHYEKYVNLPNVPIDHSKMNDVVQRIMDQPVPSPSEKLLHEAPKPPSSNAIVGLASYPKFMNGWRKLVGSLRTNGYEGHIILGVNPNIPKDERNYLDKMGVTYYAIELANCTSSILEGITSTTNNEVRAKCSVGLETLKLEWGRYEMARRWLHSCTSCTGWNMVIDTRDIFFQSDPFQSLGNPNDALYELQFIEEIAQYTNPVDETQPHRATNLGQSMRYKVHTNPCYGPENVKSYELINRPMLCSGTVIGNANGIHRFLSVLVNEFHTNNSKKGKPECKSPSTTDQWTMNYLYYKGQFGYINQTKTWPWGTGPVLTIGKPCVNSAITNGGVWNKTSQIDLMKFDPKTDLILNPHEESKKDSSSSKFYVASTLHQWDRCRRWIEPWFDRHKHLYTTKERVENEKAMHWVT